MARACVSVQIDGARSFLRYGCTKTRQQRFNVFSAKQPVGAVRKVQRIVLADAGYADNLQSLKHNPSLARM